MFSRSLIFVIAVLINLQLSLVSGKEAQSPNSALNTSYSNPVIVNAKQPSPASVCQITVEQAQRYIRSKSVLLVDVRAEESYRKSTIPGAINIPLYAIKTKSFLKGKHLVLFDDGSNPKKMVDACGKLIGKYGMKVSVLKGGVRQWNNGGKGKGILYKLTPDDYLASMNAGRWVMIDASGNDKAGTLFKGHPIIDVSNILTSNTTDNLSIVNQQKDIVVLTDYGVTTKQVTKIQQHFDQPIYLLIGGVNGYIEFLENRNRFLTRLDRGPVKAVQCVK